MDNAFKYIKENGGIDTEECYPYRAHVSYSSMFCMASCHPFYFQDERRCRYKASCSAATDTGFVDIRHRDESALQTAVANIGPISVAIDASHSSFQVCSTILYD